MVAPQKMYNTDACWLGPRDFLATTLTLDLSELLPVPRLVEPWDPVITSIHLHHYPRGSEGPSKLPGNDRECVCKPAVMKPEWTTCHSLAAQEAGAGRKQ